MIIGDEIGGMIKNEGWEEMWRREGQDGGGMIQG